MMKQLLASVFPPIKSAVESVFERAMISLAAAGGLLGLSLTDITELGRACSAWGGFLLLCYTGYLKWHKREKP